MISGLPLLLPIGLAAFILWAMFCVYLVKRVLAIRNDAAKKDEEELHRQSKKDRDELLRRLQDEEKLPKEAAHKPDVWPTDADADFSENVIPFVTNARLKAFDATNLAWDLSWESGTRKRLDELKRQASQGKAVKRDDLLWALDLVGKLGSGQTSISPDDYKWLKDAAAKLLRSTPQEYHFPEYLALVDKKACQAIPMRFDREVAPEQETRINDPYVAKYSVLQYQPDYLGLCDASLIIRPWIRPASVSPPGLIDILRTWRLSVHLDGNEILPQYPFEEFLVGPDGFGYRERPFLFPTLPSTVLAPGKYEPKQPSDFYFSAVQDEIRPSEGIFVTRESVLEVKLHLGKPLSTEPLTLTAGLVAAVYTTKAHP